MKKKNIDGELSESDFVGTPILLTLNQKNINKIQLTYDNNLLGKCELVTNNAITECLDNHTELQAKLREDLFNNIKVNFYPNEFCVTFQRSNQILETQNLINLPYFLTIHHDIELTTLYYFLFLIL